MSAEKNGEAPTAPRLSMPPIRKTTTRSKGLFLRKDRMPVMRMMANTSKNITSHPFENFEWRNVFIYSPILI